MREITSAFDDLEKRLAFLLFVASISRSALATLICVMYRRGPKFP